MLAATSALLLMTMKLFRILVEVMVDYIFLSDEGLDVNLI